MGMVRPPTEELLLNYGAGGDDWTLALEGSLDSKEIKLVNPKGKQSWIFIAKTDGEAEAPILWSSDAKSQLIGKEPDAEKNWRQKEKRLAEDEMVI